MPTDKPRVMVTLQPDTHELLQRLSSLTGVAASTIITKLLSGHLDELWKFREWLEDQPEGSRARLLGVNLLQSYGPDNLLTGMHRIDASGRQDVDRSVRAKPVATKK